MKKQTKINNLPRGNAALQADLDQLARIARAKAARPLVVKGGRVTPLTRALTEQELWQLGAKERAAKPKPLGKVAAAARKTALKAANGRHAKRVDQLARVHARWNRCIVIVLDGGREVVLKVQGADETFAARDRDAVIAALYDGVVVTVQAADGRIVNA